MSRLARTLLVFIADLALHLLDMALFFAVVALSTVVLGLVLPLPVAVGISVLAVSAWWGYRMERERMRCLDALMRGELR